MFIKVLALLFGLFLLVHVVASNAEPIYETTQGNIRLVAYNEPCKLDSVKNLAYRAVWFENGKGIEGCIGARDDLGVAVAYFADKTIAVIPLYAFRRVTAT